MEKKSQKERISFSDIFDKGFKEILASQIITVGGGLAAGILLALYTKKLLLIPGILILLPGFLEMRGSISGSFASRISSGLFLGVINPKLTKITKLIRGNIIASFWLTSVGALVLGLLAFGFNYVVLKVFTPQLIFIPIIAALISNILQIPLTLMLTLYLFKKGHDPNNIIGPFITSSEDLMSIVSLLIAVVLI